MTKGCRWDSIVTRSTSERVAELREKVLTHHCVDCVSYKYLFQNFTPQSPTGRPNSEVRDEREMVVLSALRRILAILEFVDSMKDED